MVGGNVRLYPSEGATVDDLHVFTDRPARCHKLPDGHIDFDGPCNVVVRRISTRLHTPEAECRLSLRTVFGGSRRFRTDDGRYVVDDGGYLLLNLGSRVSSELHSASPVEMFNITFQPEFVQRSLGSIVLPEDRLLDDPTVGLLQPVRFLEMTYRHDDTVSPLVRRIRDRAAEGEVPSLWLEESLHDLLGRLLDKHRGIVTQVSRLPAGRVATRIETFRRLELARNYMLSNYARAVRLDDIAGAACLSPHYFLRTFKAAHGVTPHQFLTQIRLDNARRLLSRTDMPVTDICLSVGFESLGSFSWLFKGKFGISPSQLRRESSGT